MKIYLVIGAFGDGGITTAMFNRAAMLKDAGHDCRIVYLDYMTDFDDFLAELHKIGRLRSDIEVLNPFRELAKEAQTSQVVIDPAVTRMSPGGDDVRSARLYNADDRLVGKATFDEYQQLRAMNVYGDDPNRVVRTEFSRHGWKEREITFIGGKPAEESYFAADGARFLERSLNPETGAQERVMTFKGPNGYPTIFRNNTGWHTSWLADLASGHAEKSIFICDGPGSVTKVINIPDDAAARVAVLHNNHYAEWPFAQGSTIRANSTFLKRLGELDALIVLTQEQATDVVVDFGHADKIFVLPNSVPANAVPKVEREPLRVSTFGKLVGPKRTEDAIRAFEIVLRSFPDATLNIYGMGPQRAALQKLIDSLGIGSHVTIHGYTNQAAVEMARSQVVIFPSKNEALPFVISESMLSETPVVAYKCKYGPRDLIADGLDGLLVGEGDVEGLAEGVCQILGDPQRAREMGSAGRAKILSRYTPEPMLEKWEGLFTSIA